MAVDPLKEPSGTEKRPALAAAVGLIALLVYLPALDLKYVGYDDALYIQQNQHIAKLDLKMVKWAFYPEEFRANNYHPLTWLSHAADVAVFGLHQPWGHHLVNIVLHASIAYSSCSWPMGCSAGPPRGGPGVC